MSVIRPRNRLVNFRLSEDEFDRLRNSCAEYGARSISDFARSSVLDRLNRPPEQAHDGERVFSLNSKVMELEYRVGQLLNLVHATGTSVSPAPLAMAQEASGQS